MSWYMEIAAEDYVKPTPKEDRVTFAAYAGAASGILAIKPVLIAGAAIAGPVGGMVLGIGWVVFSVAKSMAIAEWLHPDDGHRPGTN